MSLTPRTCEATYLKGQTDSLLRDEDNVGKAANEDNVETSTHKLGEHNVVPRA